MQSLKVFFFFLCDCVHCDPESSQSSERAGADGVQRPFLVECVQCFFLQCRGLNVQCSAEIEKVVNSPRPFLPYGFIRMIIVYPFFKGGNFTERKLCQFFCSQILPFQGFDTSSNRLFLPPQPLLILTRKSFRNSKNIFIFT